MTMERIATALERIADAVEARENAVEGPLLRDEDLAAALNVWRDAELVEDE